ncbi:MAG: O-antigen ligase family protein [Bacillota bacterium]
MLSGGRSSIGNWIILLLVLSALIPLVCTPYASDHKLYRESFRGNYNLKQADKIYEPKVIVLYIISALLMILGLIWQHIMSEKLEGDVSFIPLLFLLVFLILSTLFSHDIYRSLYGALYRWEGFVTFACYLTLFFSTALFVNSRSKIRYIVYSISAVAVLISVYGLLQYYGLEFIEWMPPRDTWGKRAFATLGNPDFAGSYSLLFLPAAIVMYFFAEEKIRIVAYGILSALFYSLLIATSTRSSWLAFICVLPLIIYFCWKKRILKRNLVKFIVLFSVFVLIFGILNLRHDGYQFNRVISIFSDANTVATGDGEEVQRAGSNRILIYQTSLPLLLENPVLGSGLDTFDLVFPQETYQEIVGTESIVDKAHNEYLQLGVTAGLPALVAYLVFLCFVFHRGWRNWKQDDSGLRAALLIAFLAYIVQAFFNISVVSVAPIFWIVMGLNIAVNRVKMGAGRPPRGVN